MDINERLAKVETNISNIKEDIKEIKTMLNEQAKWQQEKLKEMDNKYASKWVEKILIPMIILAIATVISLIKT